MEGMLPRKLPTTVAAPTTPTTMAKVCRAYTMLATVMTDGSGATLPCSSTVTTSRSAIPVFLYGSDQGIGQGLAVIEREPAFDDTVDAPDGDRQQNQPADQDPEGNPADRKSTRLNSSHVKISYA